MTIGNSVVFTDKSQGSVAIHLKCNGLFRCHFNVEIGECLLKLQAKRLIVSHTLFAY